MADALRVVVIDDDRDLRELIKITLEFTAGWEVVTAANGREGIEAVRERAPDVVVVDLMMPEMDGYAVCRCLKQDPATAAIPLVLLTARKQLDERQLGAAGASGVVFKPFEPEELASQIRRLCESDEHA